jgi:hypothetical protein
MSIKQKIKIKTFTGSGSFDIRDEMINDSKDFLVLYDHQNFYLSL